MLTRKIFWLLLVSAEYSSLLDILNIIPQKPYVIPPTLRLGQACIYGLEKGKHSKGISLISVVLFLQQIPLEFLKGIREMTNIYYGIQSASYVIGLVSHNRNTIAYTNRFPYVPCFLLQGNSLWESGPVETVASGE